MENHKSQSREFCFMHGRVPEQGSHVVSTMSEEEPAGEFGVEQSGSRCDTMHEALQTQGVPLPSDRDSSEPGSRTLGHQRANRPRTISLLLSMGTDPLHLCLSAQARRGGTWAEPWVETRGR